LVEDAIAGRGTIDPNNSGVYFRLVWHSGMSDTELRRYARAIADFAAKNLDASRYPERILQELDKRWMVEFPGNGESLLYRVNPRYAQYVLDQTGDKAG